MFLARTNEVDHWFDSIEKVEAFLKEKAPPAGEEPGGRDVVVTELHEVKTINRMLKESAGKIETADLVPVPLRPGEEPKPRYFYVDPKENKHPLETLRDLVKAVRNTGKKQIEVRRFKGLGEMNAEQLWETTMDPSRRTMLRVTVEDAAAADEMFRVLMGDEVEPRREFIERHALEVRNLDYHA